MIVDSYTHVSALWFEPVETLIGLMERSGIDRAVLVGFTGQFDNEYLFDARDRFADRLWVVPEVDASDRDWPAIVKRFVQRGAAGLRMHADTRSTGSDPLAIWKTARDLGMPVSCLGRSEEFASTGFADLLAAVDGLTVIVEHLGQKRRLGLDYGPEAARAVYANLARFDGVHMQIHGLGELVPRSIPVGDYPFQGDPEVLFLACREFPPHRMLWGSDFPSVCGREGYANSRRLTREVLARQGRSDDELDGIFGGTALRIYPSL